MKFLMWKDTIIGEINDDKSVDLKIENIPKGISINRNPHWTTQQFRAFLDDRIISRERRDIERVLFRCGLSSYDTFTVADRTKAINAKDMFWLSDTGKEVFTDAITNVFESVFLKNIDMTGDSIDTPEGCNIKRYGVYNNRYGIYKRRLHPLSKDVESEVAVYNLAKRIGVPCCRAIQTDENTVFSEFEYNFAEEQIVHFRRLLENIPRSGNELNNLIAVRPQYQESFNKMIFLDFITRQDDRHLSNIAVVVNTNSGKENFYPLYDNGRSLFYQDTEETMRNACKQPTLYSTTFGAEGSYYDYVLDIVSENPEALKQIDTTVSSNEIYKIFKNSGFKEQHLEYATQYVSEALNILNSLSIKRDINPIEEYCKGAQNNKKLPQNDIEI